MLFILLYGCLGLRCFCRRENHLLPSMIYLMVPSDRSLSARMKSPWNTNFHHFALLLGSVVFEIATSILVAVCFGDVDIVRKRQYLDLTEVARCLVVPSNAT